MPDAAANTEQSEQRTALAVPAGVAPSVPESGRRLAFQEIRRQLSDTDFANPGTQKLILEMLFTAESERDDHKAYVTRFHEADKKASILEEKLKSNNANEIFFGVGVGVGCAIIGLAPSFWTNTTQGSMCLLLGAVLVIGATIGRIAHK